MEGALLLHPLATYTFRGREMIHVSLENRGIVARLSSTPSEVQIEDVHGVLATQPGASRLPERKQRG